MKKVKNTVTTLSPKKGVTAKPGPAKRGRGETDEVAGANDKTSLAATDNNSKTGLVAAAVVNRVDALADRIYQATLEEAEGIAVESMKFLVKAVEANADVLDLLVDKLDDNEHLALLLKGLGGLASPVLPDLIDRLQDNQYVTQVVDAIVAICSAAKVDPAHLLQKRLEKASCDIRAVAEVVAGLAGPNGQQAVVADDWLASDRPELRAAGLLVKALVPVPDFPLVSAIGTALERKHICVRIAAVQAIYSQPVSEELVKLLSVAIKDEVFSVRDAAISSMYHTEEWRSAMVPVLLGEIKTATPPEVFYLADALVRMADSTNDPACVLLALADQSEEPNVQYELKHALCRYAPNLFSEPRRPRGWK